MFYKQNNYSSIAILKRNYSFTYTLTCETTINIIY